MNQIKNKRAGLPADLSAEELKKILSVNDENFRQFSKNHLLTEEAVFYKTGFYSPKGNSISKRSDQENIKEYRLNNYDGFWRESGWIPQRNNKFYLSKPRSHCPRNLLPYSSSDATGAYIDLNWSGYQDDYDNSKYCVAGILKQNLTEEGKTRSFPYRNVFEIFEHSGFQYKDISNHRFYLESGYRHGQKIGYNKIYFQSGLNPSEVVGYKCFVIPNRRITDYDNRLGKIHRAYIPSTDLLNEPHNIVRYNAFFYTGEVPIVYLTGSNNQVKRGFGFGSVYQHSNPEYRLNTNSNNFRVTATGIYGESISKTISIFNTGNITERFYIGIDNPSVISIDHHKTPGIPNYGVWTNENQLNKTYGQIIDKVYKVGREANINFNIKINTAALPANQVNTVFLNIYRITGGNIPFNNQQFPSKTPQKWWDNKGWGHKNRRVSFELKEIVNTGYFSQKYALPIDIYARTNSSKVDQDNIFYQNLASGDYKPINVIGQPIDINPESDNKHIDLNKQIGLTFYNIGDNTKDLRVKLDTLAKIKQKGLGENA